MKIKLFVYSGLLLFYLFFLLTNGNAGFVTLANELISIDIFNDGGTDNWGFTYQDEYQIWDWESYLRIGSSGNWLIDYSVVEQVQLISQTGTTALIQAPDTTLQVRINSHLGAGNSYLTQNYTLTNTGELTTSDIFFSQYLDSHLDGSFNGSQSTFNPHYQLTYVWKENTYLGFTTNRKTIGYDLGDADGFPPASYLAVEAHTFNNGNYTGSITDPTLAQCTYIGKLSPGMTTSLTVVLVAGDSLISLQSGIQEAGITPITESPTLLYFFLGFLSLVRTYCLLHK